MSPRRSAQPDPPHQASESDASAPPVPADWSDWTDERLLAAHLAGDERAFRELVRRYERDLFNFLYRFTNQRAAADDLFQETFLQVHVSADTFDLSRRFKPWLFTVAANKARDFLRRRQRRKTVPLLASVDGEEGGQAFVDLMQADVPVPEQTADANETAQMVREAVAEMPDHLREVLLLAYFERMPYKEVAETLNVPLGTVKSRLHTAVATFAELWKARFGDHGKEIAE